VSRTQFDHTSLLKLIEWRWSLPPLTKRDATTNNLALALDFSSRDTAAPTFLVPTGPFPSACASSL
jgi:phospholipase C